ncbi:RNA polymerase sigma-70 factor, ECF subfamily [Halobacillus dabanensis]|uniref:RNA polymerase sigma factor n=1 Tax=Halobacillus dabanensis TaxID=240302 RepID=A0A1I3Z1S8_HALDA|nr:sigma-70 family RNA polymerase sigma factor [Halobacillus dabanensis]SFK38042.1 RNA polymerase sigma-70 factor, ECF subfamily [Halobacillus dabanensis]
MIRKQRTKYTNVPERIDEDRLEQWIHEYGHDLKWLAYSYVKDYAIAEDITQETFIKAYQKYSTFKNESTVKTWLYKITINACKDHLKSSYMKRVIKKGTEIFRSIPSTRETPEELIMQRDEDEALVAHVLKLEHKYREIIILYYFEEFDIKDLANVLIISPNTAKTRLRRARQLLQERLTSEGSSQSE